MCENLRDLSFLWTLSAKCGKLRKSRCGDEVHVDLNGINTVVKFSDRSVNSPPLFEEVTVKRFVDNWNPAVDRPCSFLAVPPNAVMTWQDPRSCKQKMAGLVIDNARKAHCSGGVELKARVVFGCEKSGTREMQNVSLFVDNSTATQNVSASICGIDMLFPTLNNGFGAAKYQVVSQDTSNKSTATFCARSADLVATLTALNEQDFTPFATPGFVTDQTEYFVPVAFRAVGTYLSDSAGAQCMKSSTVQALCFQDPENVTLWEFETMPGGGSTVCDISQNWVRGPIKQIPITASTNVLLNVTNFGAPLRSVCTMLPQKEVCIGYYAEAKIGSDVSQTTDKLVTSVIIYGGANTNATLTSTNTSGTFKTFDAAGNVVTVTVSCVWFSPSNNKISLAFSQLFDNVELTLECLEAKYVRKKYMHFCITALIYCKKSKIF